MEDDAGVWNGVMHGVYAMDGYGDEGPIALFRDACCASEFASMFSANCETTVMPTAVQSMFHNPDDERK